MTLITPSEAALILGLRSRGNLYRKIDSGELPSIEGPRGRMLERAGLEEAWANINRPKGVRATPASARAAISEPSAGKTQEVRKACADAVPGYNDSRARREYELANLAELDRRQREGELVYRSDMEQATRAVAAALNNQLEALPRQVRQQIPHLTVEEVQIIEGLVHQLRQAVADWRQPAGEKEP